MRLSLGMSLAIVVVVSNLWRPCGLLAETPLLPVAQQRQQQELPQGVTVHRDVAYVEQGHPRQVLDLYLPAADEPVPLVIWVHGGAWRAGDKQNCPARRFLRDGMAVASLNYRLSGHAIFPAQIRDCRAAVRWLRRRHEEFGLDPDRFGVWGSSAGGHLVALLGTAGESDAFGDADPVSCRVQAVCDFFGPTDFLQMNRQAGADGVIDHDAADSPESLLVGQAIQDAPERVRAANPITYVGDDDPPFLIVHGDRDRLVPVQQSELLAEALQQAEVDVQFRVVEGGGHGRFNDRDVDEAVRSFFLEHLGDTSD